MSIFRQHGSFVFSAVVGVTAGAAFCLMYLRLRQELRELRTLIGQLEKEINDRAKGGRLKSKRNRASYSGYYSCVTASSGDDEDEFEDALAGGDTDVEPESNKQNSFEQRSVQFSSPLTFELDTVSDGFYTEIDQLLSGSKADIQHAYNKLNQQDRRLSLKPEFQWRWAEAAYSVAIQAGERGDANKKKELMYRAKDAAQAAMQLDPSCANAHKWYAITLGCVGDYETMSEKIKNAFVIKDHIQVAMKLNPTDPGPHHMMGRWCFSVYMLTWLERKAASAFFGTPPTSTADEALEHFMQAENLKPGKWKENMLYIAKCLIEKKENSEAAVWLRTAAQDLEEDSADDNVKAEITNLLAKYGV